MTRTKDFIGDWTSEHAFAVISKKVADEQDKLSAKYPNVDIKKTFQFEWEFRAIFKISDSITDSALRDDLLLIAKMVYTFKMN